jgi:hypothetical protein
LGSNVLSALNSSAHKPMVARNIESNTLSRTSRSNGELMAAEFLKWRNVIIFTAALIWPGISL